MKRYVTWVLLPLMTTIVLCCGSNEESGGTEQPIIPDSTRLSGILDNTYWTLEDTVSVFCLQSIRQAKYLLSEGEGKPSGEFRLTEDSSIDFLNGKLYAMTSHRYNYGLSATDDEKPILTTGIPTAYSLDEVVAPSGCTRKPVPYWASVSMGEQGSLSGTFKGLTALLKIRMAGLPTRTKAIVLSTHRYYDLNDEMQYGGYDNRISGTFESVLEENAKLSLNPIFFSYDTIRVNITADYVNKNDDSIYIPIVSESYGKLLVIAVTDDNYRSYKWYGTTLALFEDTTFLPNTIVEVK